MMRLGEQNHYEVLEVSRSAETPEIERAYRLLQSIYGADSLALYSVFARPRPPRGCSCRSRGTR